MSYTIDIVVPTVPESDAAAWDFVDALRARSDDEAAPASVLAALHARLTSRYPCLSSYRDDDPALEHCAWSDGPLIDNFCGQLGTIGLQSSPTLEQVLAFVVESAGQLGLTVLDPQEGLVHRPPRPAGHSVAIDGVLDGFAPQQVAASLARLVKRDEAAIRALLAAPGTVVKQGLDEAGAEKYRATLTGIGCACRILAPAATPLEQLQAGAQRGDAESQYQLSMAYALAKGVPQDDALAAQWVEKAAEQGHLAASYVLANCYYQGLGVFKNYAVALHWARAAAERGHAAAQFLLWRMYAHGEGVRADPIQAALWLRKAAEQGHAAAEYQTGKQFYLERNLPFALTWFRRAAAQANADAQSHLAVMYATGDRLQRDPLAALELQLKAAFQGHAVAQYNLGVMLETGDCVEPDDPQALEWYAKAAAQGHAMAAYTLGTRYALGLGVDKDMGRAFDWMRQAAEHGEVRAQTRLALMYLDGEGVRADKEQSLHWIRKAAAQGDPDARRYLQSTGR